MTRNFNFADQEFYHLYNRGTEKRTIFLTRGDYERFLSLLYIANQSTPVDVKLQGGTLNEILRIERSEPLVAIGAYCLMPNHFHILAKEVVGGGISKFMQKVLTGYTMYFNKRHERSGALFQGTFRASHIQDDRYLKYLVSYIHLNPVKLIEPKWKETGIADPVGAEVYLAQYRYSSYPGYFGRESTFTKILTLEEFPRYFETDTDFLTYHTEWLNYNTE